MDLKQVCRVVGFKKTTIYKWIKNGDFPRAVKIGNCSRWASTEVEEWIEKKIYQSRS
ncbi:helix-turn-helix transcriptional regulator [Erwinia rhapontici]|uniref:helix-turn-helix transcriptional regulator n=1 Tax=Erwinia rhapontici TaxID=55212 RepID=UPI001414EC2B|nr:AlpA family phage regulatory protein [Erwinia rhapontici]